MPSGIPKDPEQKLIKSVGYTIHEADKLYASAKENKDREEMAKAQALYNQAKEKLTKGKESQNLNTSVDELYEKARANAKSRNKKPQQ